MTFETANWEVTDYNQEAWSQAAERAEKIKKITQPETPTAALGDIALSFIIGGALSGSVFPRTEALTLEGIASAVEIGDELRSEDDLALSA